MASLLEGGLQGGECHLGFADAIESIAPVISVVQPAGKRGTLFIPWRTAKTGPGDL